MQTPRDQDIQCSQTGPWKWNVVFSTKETSLNSAARGGNLGSDHEDEAEQRMDTSSVGLIGDEL